MKKIALFLFFVLPVLVFAKGEQLSDAENDLLAQLSKADISSVDLESVNDDSLLKVAKKDPDAVLKHKKVFSHFMQKIKQGKQRFADVLNTNQEVICKHHIVCTPGQFSIDTKKVTVFKAGSKTVTTVISDFGLLEGAAFNKDGSVFINTDAHKAAVSGIISTFQLHKDDVAALKKAGIEFESTTVVKVKALSGSTSQLKVIKGVFRKVGSIGVSVSAVQLQSSVSFIIKGQQREGTIIFHENGFATITTKGMDLWGKSPTEGSITLFSKPTKNNEEEYVVSKIELTQRGINAVHNVKVDDAQFGIVTTNFDRTETNEVVGRTTRLTPKPLSEGALDKGYMNPWMRHSQFHGNIDGVPNKYPYANKFQIAAGENFEFKSKEMHTVTQTEIETAAKNAERAMGSCDLSQGRCQLERARYIFVDLYRSIVNTKINDKSQWNYARISGMDEDASRFLDDAPDTYNKAECVTSAWNAMGQLSVMKYYGLLNDVTDIKFTQVNQGHWSGAARIKSTGQFCYFDADSVEPSHLRGTRSGYYPSLPGVSCFGSSRISGNAILDITRFNTITGFNAFSQCR